MLAHTLQGQRLCRRVLVLVTEDWFALSHFRPLLATLRELAAEVVVATRSSGRLDEIAALGVRTRPLDFHRGSANPLAHLRSLGRLAALIGEEQPDVVHAIAMQPMVLASLALPRSAHEPRAVLLHLTGLGFIGVSRSPLARVVRPAALAAMRRTFRAHNAWLLAENPDDAAFMNAAGVGTAARTAVLPGAGIDPQQFPALPPPDNAPPAAAFVGRMLHQKGVAVLIEAQRRLRARGVAIDVDLYGASDAHNPGAVSAETLAEWSGSPGVRWHGHVSDIAAVWRRADIAVVPTVDREGMPRAMLEAAACARPLVVTNIPGCRHFVRDRIEGFVVPPGDADALAAALERLAGDPALRHRQGAAARRRLLDEFTTEAVASTVRAAYVELMR